MKKTLALFLAALMLVMLFPVSVMADDDFDFDLVYDTAEQWVESNSNLSWASESDLDFSSLPEYYRNLYRYSFSDGVLDIEVIGDENNSESWYSKLFEDFNGNTAMNFMIQNSDSLMNGFELGASIDGTGEDFFEEAKEKLNDNFNNNFHTIFFTRTAQVSNFNLNAKRIIPVENESRYTLIGLKSGTDVSYKIFITHVHASEETNGFEISENNVSAERISANFTGKIAEENLLKYESFDGKIIISYIGEKTNANDIVEDLVDNERQNRTVNICIKAPDGYIREKEEETFEIEFDVIKNRMFNKNPVEKRITWVNKNNPEDTYAEKVFIKFDSPVKAGKTWMDEVASPTDEARIVYKYKENSDDKYKEISSTDLASMTNMVVENEGNGLLHLSYNNAEVTVWKYNDIIAEILPPVGATKYRIYGADNNIWAEEKNDYFENEAEGMLSGGDFIDPKIYPAAINIQQFDELTTRGVTIHYSKHSDGNSIIIVYWFNDQEEIVKKDFLYTYADDYSWGFTDTVKTNTDEALKSENIAVCLDGIEPLQSNPNIDMICSLYPQESDDQKHYYVVINTNGKNKNLVDGNYYTVYFPISYFGFTTNELAKNAGFIPIIEHLDDAHIVQETICGNYVEGNNRVAFSVKSFCPLVIGMEDADGFYILGDRNTVKGKFDSLSKAIEKVSKDEVINAVISGTNTIKGDKEFLIKTNDSNIKATLIPEDGYELYVNGVKVSQVEIGTEEKTVIIKKILNNSNKNTTVIEVGKISDNVDSNETNPNTGAVNFIGVFESLAVLAFAGTFLGKKR